MIQIRNWSKFQHYKDRAPPWIKIYRDLIEECEEWFALSDGAARLLVELWLLASKTRNGAISQDHHWIKWKLRKQSASKVLAYLQELTEHGFIETVEDQNSIMLAGRLQHATPEGEGRGERGEAETKKETEPKPPPTPYENEFFVFWDAYPKKVGKQKARKAFQARRRAGVKAKDIQDALKRYLAWAEATDTILMHPSTFVGPDENWLEPWTIPEAATTAEKGNGQGEPILEPKFRKPFEPVIQERKRKAKPVDQATGADLAKTIPAVTNPAEEAAKIRAEREKLETLLGGEGL
jgi:hypothetical protein